MEDIDPKTVNAQGLIASQQDKGPPPTDRGTLLISPEEEDFLDGLTEEKEEAEETSAEQQTSEKEEEDSSEEKEEEESSSEEKKGEEEKEEKKSAADLLDGEIKVEKEEEKEETGEEKPEEEEKKKEFPSGPRDLEGFDEETSKALKKTANESFAVLAPKLRRLSEVETKLKEIEETGLPADYYQNSESYKLTPEYREIAAKDTEVQLLEQFWSNSIANIQQGKAWQDISFDAEGKPRIVNKPAVTTKNAEGEDVPALDQEGLTYVSTELAKTQAQKQNILGQLNSIKTNFGQAHKQYVDALSQKEAQLFPEMREPGNKYEKDIQAIIGKFPRYLQNNPFMGFFAKGLITYNAEVAAHNKLKKEYKALIGNKKDQELAGVSASALKKKEKKSSSSKGGKAEYSLEDFDDL